MIKTGTGYYATEIFEFEDNNGHYIEKGITRMFLIFLDQEKFLCSDWKNKRTLTSADLDRLDRGGTYQIEGDKITLYYNGSTWKETCIILDQDFVMHEANDPPRKMTFYKWSAEKDMEIRNVKTQDYKALKEVLDSSELFPSELLEDMITDYFDNEASTDIWFTATIDNHPVAIAYCAPERMTEGTYNLYAIAVHKDYQGKGIGGKMMKYIEKMLKEAGHRILIVETSGLPEYELTRKFYHKCHYNQEARIRDFYTEGEDKVVFWKKLN